MIFFENCGLIIIVFLVLVSLILFVHIVAFLVKHFGMVELLILLVLGVVLGEVPTLLLLVLTIISVFLQIDLLTELLLVGLFRWDNGVHFFHLSLQGFIEFFYGFFVAIGVLPLELADRLRHYDRAPFLLEFLIIDVLQAHNDFLQEFLNVLIRHNFEAFLDNIIAEIALDDLMKLRRVAELLDDFILNMGWSPVDAFLNELGAKFILR